MRRLIAMSGLVFRADKEAIKKIATDAAHKAKAEEQKYPDTNWRYEYSPESYTGTEIDYAVEIVARTP